jgi:DNA-binding HxlR family transcriptional regulator
MFKEKQHYGDFLQGDEKIATNILADRLLRLEQCGIIIKIADPGHGSRYIYKLTKRGIDLLPLLTEIILWSSKYDDETAAETRFINKAKRDKEGLLKQISTGLKEKLAE